MGMRMVDKIKITAVFSFCTVGIIRGLQLWSPPQIVGIFAT